VSTSEGIGVDIPAPFALGAVVMSINTCAEPELRALAPAEVGIFATRVRLAGTSDAELVAAAGEDAPNGSGDRGNAPASRV